MDVSRDIGARDINSGLQLDCPFTIYHISQFVITIGPPKCMRDPLYGIVVNGKVEENIQSVCKLLQGLCIVLRICRSVVRKVDVYYTHAEIYWYEEGADSRCLSKEKEDRTKLLHTLSSNCEAGRDSFC